MSVMDKRSCGLEVSVRGGARSYKRATRAGEARLDDGEYSQIQGGLVFDREVYGYALGMLERGQATPPDHTESLYLLGFTRKRQGNASGARQVLERALQLQPTSCHAAKSKRLLAELE